MGEHLADIICGNCGEKHRIALGIASAILCSACKVEIQIAEPETPSLPLEALKVKLIRIAREWLSEELYYAEQPETAEMMRGARMAAGMCAREILEVVR